MARILVADDDANYRSTLVLELEAEGHEVLEADDGFTACQLAEAHRPDLVLLAEGLPVFDAYDVCRRFRSDPDLTATPTVLLAAALPDPRRTDAAAFTEVLPRDGSGQRLRDAAVRLLGPLANPRG